MQRASRTLAVSAVTLIAAGTLAACGSSGSGSGSDGTGTNRGSSLAGQTITLYNGQHEQTTQRLVQGFTAATGIKVAVRSDDEDVFVNQLETEGSHSPADVFFTENTPALEALQEKNLLAPVNASSLAQVPAKYSSPQGDWAGVSARVSVMVYNPSLIAKSALPTTALGLADPQYKGKIGIAPGETDFSPIVTSMIKQYGSTKTEQWLQGLKTNAGEDHNYPDNETLVADVNDGKVAFGVINQYYWYRLGAQIGTSNYHSQLAYFAPRDPGYVINVSGVGIVKSTSHLAAAQKFVQFITSKAGQEIIADSDSFEYPIGSGVQPSAKEKPFRSLKPNPIDIAQLGDGSGAVDLLKQAQLL